MTNYRVVSEGMYVIDPEGQRLPGLRQVPVWESDHYPSFEELREISANQADVETQAKVNKLASGDEAEKVLEALLGEQYYIPSHWPLLLQQQRVGRILGYKTLGQVNASDLLVENEEDFELRTYWRNVKRPMSEAEKDALKGLSLLLGKYALCMGGIIGAIELYNKTKGA